MRQIFLQIRIPTHAVRTVYTVHLRRQSTIESGHQELLAKSLLGQIVVSFGSNNIMYHISNRIKCTRWQPNQRSKLQRDTSRR